MAVKYYTKYNDNTIFTGSSSGTILGCFRRCWVLSGICKCCKLAVPNLMEF
nr:MAG TPA: Hefutoxin family [Siphoviridae sp. ctHdl3]